MKKIAQETGNVSVPCVIPTGAVYIYTITSTDAHALTQKLNVSSYIGNSGDFVAGFGTSVSLNYDGSTLAVGAPNALSYVGRVYVFKQQTDGMFALVGMLDDSTGTSGDVSQLGISVGISADGGAGGWLECNLKSIVGGPGTWVP